MSSKVPQQRRRLIGAYYTCYNVYVENQTKGILQKGPEFMKSVNEHKSSELNPNAEKKENVYARKVQNARLKSHFKMCGAWSCRRTNT